jgi:hypothetical protein
MGIYLANKQELFPSLSQSIFVFYVPFYLCVSIANLCLRLPFYHSLLVMASLYACLVSCLLVSYVFIYLSCLPTLAYFNFFACPQWFIFLAVILLIKNNSRKNDDPFLSTLPPFLPVCLSSLCAADGNNATKTLSLMSVPQFCFPSPVQMTKVSYCPGGTGWY